MSKKKVEALLQAPVESHTYTTAELARSGLRNTRKLLGSEVAIDKLLDYLTQTPDPDELLRRAGIRRHQLRSLELDDEIAQCVDTFKDSVIATDWRLEPNQTRAAKFTTEQLTPNMDNLLNGILDAILYGYSVQEVIYRPEGYRIGLERVSLKPMEWFEPRNDGSLRYFPADGSKGIEGMVCDPRKFLLAVRRGRYDNPRGEALLSRLWFPMTWRREGWQMWLRFLETFGSPIVIGQVPNYKDFIAAMATQGVRSTVAWQTSSDRDSVTTITASTPGEFERLENALIRRAQKLILGQTLTSDTSTGGGSYAQAAVHNQVRQDKRRAALRFCTKVIQTLVDTLCQLNGFARLEFLMAENAGLEAQRAARDAVLAPVLAASGLKLSRGYFTDVYDYRDADLEDKPVLPNPLIPSTETDEEKPPVTGDRSVADVEGRGGKDAQEEAEANMATAIFAAAQTRIDQLVDQTNPWPIPQERLFQAIREARDPDDLQQRLIALWPAGESLTAFEQALTLARLAAQVIGYVGVQQGTL